MVFKSLCVLVLWTKVISHCLISLFFPLCRSEAADPVFYGGEPRGESAIKYEDEIGNNIVQSYEVSFRNAFL